ncbi:hypothetical protein BDK51DRAFT_32387, partial [Blyttiomyces helicus]
MAAANARFSTAAPQKMPHAMLASKASLSGDWRVAVDAFRAAYSEASPSPSSTTRLFPPPCTARTCGYTSGILLERQGDLQDAITRWRRAIGTAESASEADRCAIVILEERQRRVGEVLNELLDSMRSSINKAEDRILTSHPSAIQDESSRRAKWASASKAEEDSDWDDAYGLSIAIWSTREGNPKAAQKPCRLAIALAETATAAHRSAIEAVPVVKRNNSVGEVLDNHLHDLRKLLLGITMIPDAKVPLSPLAPGDPARKQRLRAVINERYLFTSGICCDKKDALHNSVVELRGPESADRWRVAYIGADLKTADMRVFTASMEVVVLCNERDSFLAGIDRLSLGRICLAIRRPGTPL